ncbi:MAG: hypothetical protein H6767_05400 [Candidatus Peribacteria bacterium]|nr:MAG: hypothetical protein H6767_05400 [Candidatus Peribacteria bacterium]
MGTNTYHLSPYAVLSGIIFVVHFLYVLPQMYLLGPVSISYKFLSYSIIVPIALSIIFLGDPFTKKRATAFILTVVSLFLFMF